MNNKCPLFTKFVFTNNMYVWQNYGINNKYMINPLPFEFDGFCDCTLLIPDNSFIPGQNRSGIADDKFNTLCLTKAFEILQKTFKVHPSEWKLLYFH